MKRFEFKYSFKSKVLQWTNRLFVFHIPVVLMTLKQFPYYCACYVLHILCSSSSVSVMHETHSQQLYPLMTNFALCPIKSRLALTNHFVVSYYIGFYAIILGGLKTFKSHNSRCQFGLCPVVLWISQCIVKYSSFNLIKSLLCVSCSFLRHISTQIICFLFKCDSFRMKSDSFWYKG